MNMQEVYTKVRTHLLTQGQQSRSGFNCLYRTMDGKSCAVGCLIADEFYRVAFEGNDVGDDRILHALESSGIELHDTLINSNGDTKTMVDLLSALQSVHDSDDVECWTYNLDQVAYDYNLKVEA